MTPEQQAIVKSFVLSVQHVADNYPSSQEHKDRVEALRACLASATKPTAVVLAEKQRAALGFACCALREQVDGEWAAEVADAMLASAPGDYVPVRREDLAEIVARLGGLHAQFLARNKPHKGSTEPYSDAAWLADYVRRLAPAITEDDP